MQKHVEPWMEICELAAREQNPAKLMELTSEIIRLLDERRKVQVAPSLRRYRVDFF